VGGGEERGSCNDRGGKGIAEGGTAEERQYAMRSMLLNESRSFI
jgi:hypothetical protein